MNASEDAWLAVIDMQRVFAEPDSPWRAPRFAGTIGPIAALARRSASASPSPGSSRPPSPTAPGAATTSSGRSRCSRPTRASTSWSTTSRPASTLDATTFGKWGPELAGQVGGRRLVLAGVSTDCCVLSTALAAADAGVQVQVVADACAGATDESHEQALAIMALYGPLIEVVRAADLTG